MSKRTPDIASGLDSPFLNAEILEGATQEAVDPKLERFALQSPFARAFPPLARPPMWRSLYLYPDEKPAPSGGSGTPAATYGRPDFWPDAVFVAKPKGDSFLNAASEFHKLWGFKPIEFESLEELIGLIAKEKQPEKRIRVISHAADGILSPLFQGSPAGFDVTRDQVEALNIDDGALMDVLLDKLVDLDTILNDGSVFWQAILRRLESAGTTSPALKPFGFTSSSKPAGDGGVLFRRTVELVAVGSTQVALRAAIGKSIAGARQRLKRSVAETNALEAAVRSSPFTFAPVMPQQTIDRVKAALDAIDKRDFRNVLKSARTRLKGKWLDFRGCRLGSDQDYLKALAILLGTDGCTAPDWWSGYPGTPIRVEPIASAKDLQTIVKASTAAEEAMDRWGSRAITGWSTLAPANRPQQFFDKFLVAAHGMFPVYEPDHSGAVTTEKHTLYWNTNKAKQRWLESMWDRAPQKTAEAIAKAWGRSAPRMPALARHLQLRSSTTRSPQEIFVAPEHEFRDHIIEVKHP